MYWVGTTDKKYWYTAASRKSVAQMPRTVMCQFHTHIQGLSNIGEVVAETELVDNMRHIDISVKACIGDHEYGNKRFDMEIPCDFLYLDTAVDAACWCIVTVDRPVNHFKARIFVTGATTNRLFVLPGHFLLVAVLGMCQLVELVMVPLASCTPPF